MIFQSHLQLLGFQINPLPHLLSSIKSLHSHLYLSLFHICLLLQTLSSNLHLHLQVSCHFICLVSLFLDIRLNDLIFVSLIASEHYFWIWIININTTTTASIYLNAVRIKSRFITVSIYYFWSYFILLITHWNTFRENCIQWI